MSRLKTKGKYIVVLTTCPSMDEARRIVTKLVDEHLIACGNILENVSSLFWWQGKLCDEQEVLIIMKTRLELLEKLSERIRSLHSYQVPEVIALPILGGNKDYLEWIAKETETS